MGVETWLLLATVVVLAWMYSRWRHSYWSSNGVPSPPSLPFLGHFLKDYLANSKAVEYYQENYTKFYDTLMCGTYYFFKPILVIWNPEILKHVFVKDFDHFTELRGDFNIKTGYERDQMMSEMLFLKNGAEWKNLRAIMTPIFSSGKMKNMFPLVCDKADALVKYSMKQAAENPHMDMKKIYGQFTIDTIATCAFGIECNSMGNNTAEFPRKAEAFFRFSITTLLKVMLNSATPRLFKFLGLSSINPPEVDFFIDVVKQTVAAREAGGEKRGDFLDLLLEARASSNDSNSDSKHVLDDMTLVAQSVLFIVVGYESTASLLSFSSFLLAKNLDQQQRLRDELRQMVAEHGGITYQGITEAKLLEACLQETLRLYPPVMITERSCTKTYKVPGTDVILKPGHLVQVPIWSLHHDPNYWPDPEAFKPDRFLPENKGDIQPFTHMPFGMGPRNCIAMRFALMEAKVALTKMLLEVELKVSPGHEELDLETNSGLMRPKKGIILELKPIKE